MGVTPRPLGDYAPAAGAEALERLRAAAEPLHGARVLHVSAAGGGRRVPGLLGAQLPLLADLGVQVEWRVLFGGSDLADAAGALHDGLQGAESALETGSTWDDYLEACRHAAAGLDGSWDAVVLHDPAPIGLAAGLEGAPLVWRAHIDASQAEAEALERATGVLGGFAAAIFSDASFAPDALRGTRVHAAAPGIDPLSSLNLELQPRLAGRLVRSLGLDLSRPLCCQLMRLDGWKDPHATIEAFDLAKGEVPGLQLVLAGALEGAAESEWRAAKELSDYAAGRADLHLITSYERVGDAELGALQRLSRVTVQSSLHEGFGLAASESLWKGTPVVGGTEGGVALQVRDGIDGYLCDRAEEAAGRLVELVRDPGLAVEMGRAGRERVRERFLVTRALEDELRALAATLQPA